VLEEYRSWPHDRVNTWRDRMTSFRLPPAGHLKYLAGAKTESEKHDYVATQIKRWPNSTTGNNSCSKKSGRKATVTICLPSNIIHPGRVSQKYPPCYSSRKPVRGTFIFPEGKRHPTIAVTPASQQKQKKIQKFSDWIFFLKNWMVFWSFVENR
jgi:hypothetical protein